MLTETFRFVLDQAASGDQAAQGRLNDLAREGTLASHVNEVTAAEDRWWDDLVADVAERSGGPLSERSLVGAMLDMAGLPHSAAPVDLANDVFDVPFVPAPIPTNPTNPPNLRGRLLAARLEDEARRFDPTWADRTAAEITSASDLAWGRLRAAESVARSAPGDPDSALTQDEFARKYGIGSS